MSAETAIAPAPVSSPPPAGKILRRLFLTLFLRGRSARGLKISTAPSSIGKKLGWSLVLYTLFGSMAFALMRQTLFAFSFYLHTTTLVFVGLFVAASSGEVLFNQQEADILLHRPVTARSLLWAKIAMLVTLSLWLAGSFNALGFIAGMYAGGGSPLFVPAHLLSVVLSSFFCVGLVVVFYQLCLRLFGRERLDAMMTLAQVVVAIAAIFAGQLPNLLFHFNGSLSFSFHWWVWLVPTAWFAGLDDAIAGSHSLTSLSLGGIGVIATLAICWSALGRLAQDYESGLQTLGEARATLKPHASRRRWLDKMSQLPPLRWWFRDPVTRATFLLIGAYLTRDRDVKLRLYPGLAPMMVWPMIMFLQNHRMHETSGWYSGFTLAFSGIYIGIIPLTALSLLQYSQQWQAADLFRQAPLPGPGLIITGSRRAALFLLGLPAALIVAALTIWLQGLSSQLCLLLPGVLALPFYAVLGASLSPTPPLSLPIEEGKSTRNGAVMMAVMFISMAAAALFAAAWSFGWFWWVLLVEVLGISAAYFPLRHTIMQARWSPID